MRRVMHEELTDRQRAVLQLAWDGLDMKETAQAIGLSWRTVKNYRAMIYLKWGVRNVEGMLRQGVERGLLTTTRQAAEWPGHVVR